MNDLSSRYRETSIDAANKAKLVQMLLARAIQHARAGSAAAAAGQVELRFNENQRIAEIISVLRGHLDLERGAGIARQLDAIYGHLQIVLVRIDVRGDAKLYDHLIEVLSDLERAWSEVARTPAAFASPSADVSASARPAPTAAKPAGKPDPSPSVQPREGFSLRV